MEKKIAESIGLLRHQIISPVLMESGRAQMRYFREIEKREFDVPARGLKRFRASTMKNWLYRYRAQGFPGLIPKTRSDEGKYRRHPDSVREGIRKLRKELLEWSVVKFYDRCLKEQLLGDPPMCLATLRRFLRIENLFPQKAKIKSRKRFEMSRFGELWIGDFMHGPLILGESPQSKKKKAILMAMIDDHSRMIVGGEFGFEENTLLLEKVFKEAILTYGLPDRLYVDNGASFSSHYLARVCAHLGIGLVHSKPYDSPSRGKVERFFRTVREGFLTTLHPNAELRLNKLNELFFQWLRQEYHHKHHHGIECRPIDRYGSSLALYPLRRVDEEHLEEFFMISLERTVNRDCTLSFNGVIYEVPPGWVGKRVELRHVQDSPKEVYLYENGIRVQKLLPVDARANGKTYRPTERDPHVSFQHLNAEQRGNHD